MSELKKCPACAEDIKIEAKKCRFCGEEFVKKEKKPEKVLYTARPHWLSYTLSVIILIISIGFPPLILLSMYLSYYQYSKKIVLTNKKLTYKYGIIQTTELNLKLEKIESVELKGGILDSIFKIGTIKVSGTGGANNLIPNISKVRTFHKKIEKVID